ncbi:hypothetical protein [Paremcibacter congregatus]|uniref:Uncharacterized protein n=1 Tax=Paremcibacter congregatus TaxID=2043170 RepID=A0A2G4YYX8_9PROT|nr:hypothetical protein [Paremcibacter congregatus]PHZ86656.1 hypothetical protein CRD36_01920 [Paremcibacter congregatus]QDE26457.1 hypothetical protein FIV45_03795 [Paremcibacter congregatus]|tara:strand:+ start:10319 stop:11017 length:699 start_codon:yes stop_codon:yes gene_type:complete
MSLGLAHRKELQKRRAQSFWFLFKTALFFTILIGCSYYAFDTGQKIALLNVASTQEKYEQQASDLENMRLELGNTEAELTKLRNLLPNEEIQDLLGVINQKAADGIAPSRMATVIAGLSGDETCSDVSPAKRFAIITPVSQLADNSVSFYRGLITVAGTGSPTLNDDGNPEAWFDPAKPVSATFTLPGGETQEASGILPIYHSVIVNGKEYRFSIIAGRRAFADITVRSCDL